MRLLSRILWFSCLVWVASGCVTNKKVTMVQKGDVKDKDVPIDSIVRVYQVKESDYRIQPQDVLSIEFESLTKKEFDFFNQSSSISQAGGNAASAALYGELVSPEGEVSYPVIGKVKVSGLTVFEIQDKLQKIADEFLDSPKVTVRLVNFRITLLGEVVRESQVFLVNNRVSILEAIGLAGGMGELADRSRVKLIRQKGGNVDIQYLNLLDEKLITSPYYYVYQNDILVVPALDQRAFRKYFGPNLALVTSSLSLLLLTINLIVEANKD